MAAETPRSYIDLVTAGGVRRVPLEADRVTLGSSDSSDVAIHDDPSVSRLHAALERYGSTWCIRDLGSHNGTYVNGLRIVGDWTLHSSDELRIGKTRLVYVAAEGDKAQGLTATAEAAPELTRREREVLLELCRPVLGGDVFTEPASIREISQALVVSDAAVKQHLLRLYDKFGITDPGDRRRVKLANAAVHRGAVALTDLR